MDPELDVRREPPTDLSSVGEDAGLARRIRDEIEALGPMPFARFMDLALYDPDGGYYRAASARPGRSGDFITAAEIHPIFGWALARLLEEAWHGLGEPARFTVRESGAGSGTLAVAVLDALRSEASPLYDVVTYEAVEIDDARLDEFDAGLSTAGHRDHIGRAAGPIAGVVLANEVLDALPVHRVRRRGDELVELAVAVGEDGSLVEVEIPPTTSALAARLAGEGVELADGQAAEICLAIDDWVASAAAGLTRGLMVLVDYGAPAEELYDPRRRRDGTLRAYVRHQVHDDPYRHIGRQDLTAHVDVTAVERAATAAGLATVGITTQAEALVGLGVETRLQAIQADPSTSMEDYVAVRSALMRLLDPAAMGRFRLMVFGRAWPEDARLSAFSYRLPTRAGPPRTTPD
jgi:SAM-dependent MidA family methyltransferase